jgi:hypothetical protein
MKENRKNGMSVAFTANYFFNGRRRPIDNESLFMTDFVNLKIKPTQSFKDAHRDIMCVCVYRGECSYVYEYLRLYCVSQKNELSIFRICDLQFIFAILLLNNKNKM